MKIAQFRISCDDVFSGFVREFCCQKFSLVSSKISRNWWQASLEAHQRSKPFTSILSISLVRPSWMVEPSLIVIRCISHKLCTRGWNFVVFHRCHDVQKQFCKPFVRRPCFTTASSSEWKVGQSSRHSHFTVNRGDLWLDFSQFDETFTSLWHAFNFAHSIPHSLITVFFIAILDLFVCAQFFDSFNFDDDFFAVRSSRRRVMNLNIRKICLPQKATRKMIYVRDTEFDPNFASSKSWKAEFFFAVDNKN